MAPVATEPVPAPHTPVKSALSSLNLSSLKTSFQGDIVTSTDAGYNDAIARWARNATRKASVVAYPKDAQSVSNIIQWAITNNVPFAVKGGGHAVSASSSIEGGLVIDLARYINMVRVDEEKKVAYVGGGALWEAVEKEAIKYGLATPGGTVNHTGVGGLTLGGGYGHLSGEHGLVIDNLIEVTIVTADGQIRKASESENADLFWGIRGAGTNFGVVTEFVYKLHPQRKTVFAGILFFPPTMAAEVFDVAAKWWTAGPSPKQSVWVGLGGPPPDKKPTVIVSLFFNGSEAEGRENFKSFFELEAAMNTCREIPFEALNAMFNPMAEAGSNYYMTGTSFDPESKDTLMNIFERFVEMNESNPDLYFLTLFEYYPSQKIDSVPHDAMAFAARGGKPSVMLSAKWMTDSEGTLDKARDLVRETKGIADSNKSGDQVPGYVNYQYEVKDAKAFFKDHYPRLQELKAQYDPQEVFSRSFPISPAAKNN